jgi:glycosyltransferase involved in cell wall biosynthesis
MNKISLCVTSYNRPDTLRQLINSYLRQNYPNKELVISDDTPNNSIEKLIAEFRNEKTIKYFHNQPGLGFSKNLLKSIERATGDYLILLGDDDVFFSKSVLSDYVKVFEENPSVGFVYANQVRFSNAMKIEYIANFSLKNKLFKNGKEAMENMWFKSIFIGGIGIRNSKDIVNYYPKKTILHPQVELIGNIIVKKDAYIIAKNYIGFRSHDDQIIFRALKDKKIRQEGEHVTVEFFDIFIKLKKKYKLKLDFDFLGKQLSELQIIMMFKEKSVLGSRSMEENYLKFCEIYKQAKNSFKFRAAFILAKILPASSIVFSRKLSFYLIFLIKGRNYPKLERQLVAMISD